MQTRHMLPMLAIAFLPFLQGCGAGAQPGAPIGQTGGGAVAPAPTGPLDGAVTQNLPGAPDKTGNTTPGAQRAGSGTSSADNVAVLDASGLLQRGSHSNDGRLTFTQYAGPSDRTPDKNTAAGLGNRGNKLRATSLALSPNLIRENGLKGGEEIWIQTGGKTVFLGHYDDTTGNKSRNNVIDVYDPQDKLGSDSFMRTISSGNWKLVASAPSA